MEASLPTSEPPIPEGVAAGELYDGPKVFKLPQQAQVSAQNAQNLIQPIPQPHQVSPDTQKEDRYPAVILLALDVLSARLLGVVALVTACAIWGGVVWNPDMWRIVAAGAFSVLVFLPVMVLYWQAGMAGEGGSS